jgi:hypothetical protein
MLNTDELRSLRLRAERMAAEDGEYGLNNPAFMYWLVHLAIDDEREACAQLCESYENDMGMGQPQQCANAIRARGEK